MFLRYTEVVMTWGGPALLGAVAGLLVYSGLDPLDGTPLVATLFVLAGLIGTSLVAYAVRRFLLPRHPANVDETTTE